MHVSHQFPDPGQQHGRSPFAAPAPPVAPSQPVYGARPYDPYATPVLPPGGPVRRGPSKLLISLLVVLALLVVGGAVNALRIRGEEPSATRPPSTLDIRHYPALDGYVVFTGLNGRPMAASEPWGYSCAPVLLQLDPAMPAATQREIRSVVERARRDGLNIAAAQAGSLPRDGALTGTSDAWKVVPVGYTRAAAPANDLGKPQSLGGTYQSALVTGGGYEHMGNWKLLVFGRTIGSDPVAARRTARLMVARMMGLGGGPGPSSGIARHMTSRVDRFTEADMAAMHAMSGCPVPAKPLA